jgi:hypothetical protein
VRGFFVAGPFLLTLKPQLKPPDCPKGQCWRRFEPICDTHPMGESKEPKKTVLVPLSQLTFITHPKNVVVVHDLSFQPGHVVKADQIACPQQNMIINN